MYCQKCGKEINDDAVVCINCGCAVKKEDPISEINQKMYSEPKTGMGILLGIFLGLIGLIIGICLYPENTVARKTFIKSWGITFGITIGVTIIISVIYSTVMLPYIYQFAGV